MIETVRKLVPVVAEDTQPSECQCQHHDWLTCLARQEHMTPFNALITFGVRGHVTENLVARCSCKCHEDKQGQQISEQAWTANRARVANHYAERAKSRGSGRNFKSEVTHEC